MNDLFELLGLQQPMYQREEPSVQDMQGSTIRSALQNLSKQEQDVFLRNLLKNLEISGTYEMFGDQNVDGQSYGGRLGYNVPLDNRSSVRAGVSGGGFKVNTPAGTFQGSDVTSGDVGYRFGPNDLSVSYTSQGAIPLSQIPMQSFERSPFDPMNAQRVKDFWQLLYRRQF